MYGISDLIAMWRLIREDKVGHYRMLLSIAPVSRTAMDAKSSRAINKLQKDIGKNLDSLIPWETRARVLGGLRARKDLKEGKVTVLLDGGETLDENFIKNANVQRT